MARIESTASGGFFPTPEDQVPRIASLLYLEEYDEALDNMCLSVLDPCAGEGAAIEAITRALVVPFVDKITRDKIKSDAESRVEKVATAAKYEARGEEVPSYYRVSDVLDPVALRGEIAADALADLGVDAYTCEMERGRHKVLLNHAGFGRQNHQKALHGDVFCAYVGEKSRGVGLAFINPPYADHKTFGREEERFLRRCTDMLAAGGVLVFVVPHYALAASVDTFARRYEDLACYRFAGDGFNIYKQVVVFAKKLENERISPDAEIAASVTLWAERGASCPELPDSTSHRRPRYIVPMHDKHVEALDGWKMKVVDSVALLKKYRPWYETTRKALCPIGRVLPSFPLVDVMHRTYEVATPPRPAHIAAGLAAGLFNGQRIEPDDSESKLPALLVKGCFDREWRTVEEKKDKRGDVKSVVQVQQPKLVITVLDLKEHKYHTLGATLEESQSVTVATMGIMDIMKHYGRSLVAVMERQCEIRYDPRYDGDSVKVADSPRKLYVAQEHAVKAMVKFLREKSGEHVLLSAEIGCLRGDTMIHDPVVGDTVAVAERYRRAEKFHVWALSPQGDPVVAAAMPPVKYPVAQMVKVTMDDGTAVVVTPAHRFWDGKNWVKASDVAFDLSQRRGSELCRLPSISDTSLRVRARDAYRDPRQRWTPERQMRARTLYEQGKTLAEIADELGSDLSRCSDAIRAAGGDCNLFQQESKRVLAIEPVDAENYYDFHVPVFNNYWAVGLWHHNSGKSTLSLMTAKTMGAKRILVLCPPHLLDSWRNETKIVLPEAEYRVLDSISSVEALAEISSDKMMVAVLSREVAKLGHRLESVSTRCPKCGVLLSSEHDYAKKHERCEAYQAVPENTWATCSRQLALILRTQDVSGSRYLPRGAQSVADRRTARGLSATPLSSYKGIPSTLLHTIRENLVEAAKDSHSSDAPARKALVWAVAAATPSPEVILDVVRRLKPEHYDYSHFAESFLLLLAPGGALGMAFELLESFPKNTYGGGVSPVEWFKEHYKKLGDIPDAEAVEDAGSDENTNYVSYGAQIGVRVGSFLLGKNASGEAILGGAVLGSVEAAAQLLKAVGSMGVWSKGPECGEFLYQSTPEPRRYPLAKYIVRRAKEVFDFVIADEIQEYANDSAAQTIAAHRLVALRKPMVFMTGTVMNGYAKSLHPTMTAISADFRSEFGREDLNAFVDRYGYRKRILSDKEDGEIVAFGTQSDRVERSERDAGDAPGVLPLFLFRHLLASTVTLHKADLRIDLPALTQDREVIAATPAVQAEYLRILDVLKTQIKADQWVPGRAGRLFGQFGQVSSFLDCCTEDVGNIDGGGAFEIRYPESMEECGGDLVASGAMLPASTILPKEARMLAFVEAEVAAGRNVMVLGWHLRLLPRLARLLAEKIDDVVPVLYADKVSTGKRQAWIEREVVGKKRRVLLCNPVCVQTGLNSLTHFHSQWWHEDPACGPLIFRQAVGRIDRIGQNRPTKTLFGYYGETLQEKIYDLLMAKVGISTAVDGLDPSAAWAAAGIVEDEHLLGMSLGKALWDMMIRDDTNVVPISRARWKVSR